MEKKSGSGSGMNDPYHITESLGTIFWVKILKFFDTDPGSRMEKIRIRIRVGKIQIRDKHSIRNTGSDTNKDTMKRTRGRWFARNNITTFLAEATLLSC
jgi:hypothetical protein